MLQSFLLWNNNGGATGGEGRSHDVSPREVGCMAYDAEHFYESQLLLLTWGWMLWLLLTWSWIDCRQKACWKPIKVTWRGVIIGSHLDCKGLGFKGLHKPSCQRDLPDLHAQDSQSWREQAIPSKTWMTNCWCLIRERPPSPVSVAGSCCLAHS